MFDRILLVLDGGDGWADAAEFAVQMARDLKSQLIAASVVDTDTLNRLLQRRIFVEEERSTYAQELLNDAGRYLNHTKRLADKAGIQFETTLLKGCIHRVVLQEARKQQIDVIVIPSWKRSMLKRDLVPHERQLLLDETECTVIIVKSETSTSPHSAR